MVSLQNKMAPGLVSFPKLFVEEVLPGKVGQACVDLALQGSS
jgi:hypothetical protein